MAKWSGEANSVRLSGTITEDVKQFATFHRARLRADLCPWWWDWLAVAGAWTARIDAAPGFRRQEMQRLIASDPRTESECRERIAAIEQAEAEMESAGTLPGIVFPG